MAKFTEAQLKEGIKQEDFLPAYCFYGEEQFLIDHYVNTISKTMVGDHMPDFNLTMLSEGATMNQILEGVEALPVMHHHRCVLVRDFAATDCSDTDLKNLADYLADPCPGNSVVFYYATVKPAATGKWKTFLNALEKHGGVLKFSRKTEQELIKTLLGGASKRGCRMTATTASYLIECIGNDLNSLLCEIEKLCAFRHGEEITVQDVDALCAKSLAASAFEMTKAINRKDAKKALGLLDKLFRMREEPIKIMGALASSYVNLYRALHSDMASIPLAELGKDLNMKKPANLQYSLNDARRLGGKKLDRSIALLCECDKNLKSLPVDGKIVLQQTVVGLIEIAKE